MGLPWVTHGSAVLAMALPWVNHESPMGHPWININIPWTLLLVESDAPRALQLVCSASSCRPYAIQGSLVVYSAGRWVWSDGPWDIHGCPMSLQHWSMGLSWIGHGSPVNHPWLWSDTTCVALCWCLLAHCHRRPMYDVCLHTAFRRCRVCIVGRGSPMGHR